MFENPQILTGTGGVGGQRIARTYRFHGLGRARSRRATLLESDRGHVTGGVRPRGNNAIRRDRARPIEQHGRVPGLFIQKNYDSTGRRVAFQSACLPPSNLNYLA